MNLTSFSHFWGWNISEDQTLLPSLVVLFLVRGPSGYKNPKGTASVIFLLFTNNTLQKKGSIEREKCIYHLLQEGASEAANKTPESTRDSHCTHQAGSSVRIHTLKMPNSRTEDDKNHLIISESIQTPVWKNKEHQTDSKMQSLRAFQLMLADKRIKVAWMYNLPPQIWGLFKLPVLLKWL